MTDESRGKKIGLDTIIFETCEKFFLFSFSLLLFVVFSGHAVCIGYIVSEMLARGLLVGLPFYFIFSLSLVGLVKYSILIYRMPMTDFFCVPERKSLFYIRIYIEFLLFRDKVITFILCRVLLSTAIHNYNRKWRASGQFTSNKLPISDFKAYVTFAIRFAHLPLTFKLLNAHRNVIRLVNEFQQ